MSSKRVNSYFYEKKAKVTVLFILYMPGVWASHLIPVFGVNMNCHIN